MRSDDDLLAHVRREAGARKLRRQRAVIGATVVAAVVALGLGALAAGGGAGREQVQADDGGRPVPSTTTVATEPPDERDHVDDTTTSTTVPEVPVPTTEADDPVETTTTTTAPRPIRPYSMTRVADGITLTAEALQQRDRPGVVELVVTIRADRASGAGGTVTWSSDGPGDSYGSPAAEVVRCGPAATDPTAGPVDETFTLVHTYDGTGFTIDLTVTAHVGVCTTDAAETSLTFPVDIGGA